MGTDPILQAILASLLSQAIVPSDQPPSATRPMVHTLHGDLLGIRKQTASGVVVESFLGIPFATPPVGKLRFNKPLPAVKWTGVRDASQFGSKCVQMEYPAALYENKDNPLPKSEDCLYLNVYRPQGANFSTPQQPLPVMVWIHGGGFYLGAGSQYDGSEFAADGVILVTINYRLDIFGFLSNMDDVMPGNYGMLDQVMALKWVKQNIRSFGGDPNHVTIFGQSAGSGSVSLLLLSPLAKGLFHRAIMQSGASLAPWAIHHPAARLSPDQAVGLVGTMVGCHDSDPVKKLDCLRNVDAQSLLNASVDVQQAIGEYDIIFNPVVENIYGFLPDLPIKLWTQNKFSHVDTIRGFTMAEYGWYVNTSMSDSPFTDQSFIAGLKGLFDTFAFVDEEILEKSILQRYEANATSEVDKKLGLVFALSDLTFKGPTLYEGNIESTLAPEKNHFMYEFDYRPSYSRLDQWIPAVHGQEVYPLFGLNIPGHEVENATDEDRRIGRELRTLWTEFAKHGTPVMQGKTMMLLPPWHRYNASTALGLRIGAKDTEVSYKNHPSMEFFPQMLQRMDTALVDKYIVG